MVVAAGALRTGAPGGRNQPASHRHRRRHYRAKEPSRKDHGGGFAAARRHRDHTRSLRAVGRRQSPGAVQFKFPGTASPARQRRRGGYALRNGRGGGPQTDHSHHHRQRGRPDPRRAHLRSATQRRPLAAHQRAPHQGRRLMSPSAPTSPRSSSTSRN